MQFNSKAGQELRTWILFFVGVSLAIIFAIKGNPLNPWWTLIIGAFTCTAVIVSAVTALAGGISDAGKKAIEEAKRSDPSVGPNEKNEKALSVAMGHPSPWLIWGIRRRNPVRVQSYFGSQDLRSTT